MTKYLINSEKKIVTQKATMEYPERKSYEDITDWEEAIIAYNRHCDKLFSFPAEWVTADQDGKEVEPDKDFRLQYQALTVKSGWIETDQESYELLDQKERRIVAVAIPAEKESGGERIEAIAFAKWLVKSNFAMVNGEWFNVVDEVPKKYVYTMDEIYDEYKGAASAVNSSGGSTNSTSH